MTGRRLYDHHCDAFRANVPTSYVSGVGFAPGESLLAWPFLSRRERDQWSDLARRITPKRKT